MYRSTLLVAASLLTVGLAVAPAASASLHAADTEDPPAYCAQWYEEAGVGPLKATSNSSCSYAVHVTAEDKFHCYQWYHEGGVGPVEIVSTSSCSYAIGLDAR